ncbi:MAG: DUF3500 domain-containing protein [Anaerolineae bacterium]|nr:DUF3500 domain-containing protein [Anaerolineae bacterium]
MAKTFTRRQVLKYAAVSGIGGLIAANLPIVARAAQPITTKGAQAQELSLAQSIAQAATAFLDTLNPDQRAKASYDFSNNERFRWHWTMPSGFPRNGLPLREMDDAQKALAFALLSSSLSEYGYQKSLDIMSLQNDLGNDPQLYFVTVFGTVGDPAGWGWRWEGHHLSRHYTIVGEKIEVTPFFHGSWPTTSDAGLRAMPREEDAALELVNSLPDDLRNKAIFQGNTLTNHITSNNPRVTPLGQVGVPYGELNADQQKLVVEIMQAYLNVLPEALAETHYQRVIDGGLEQVLFAWAGSLEHRRPQYYRLQGANFVMEFDNSRNRGTHIHSVWREFDNDFGYNLLKA